MKTPSVVGDARAMAFALAAMLLTMSPRALAAPVVTEDFPRPLGDAWKALDGTWSVADGVLAVGVAADGKPVEDSGFALLAREDFHGQDVEVTAEVAYLSGNPHAAAGIQFRIGEDRTGYAAGLREVEKGPDWERPLLQLYRMDREGGWKLLQESKVMNCRAGELRKLKVQCKGPDIFVYYEDMETPVIREFDDGFTRAGKVGLWKDQTGGAKFDNVSIGEVGKTPEPPSRVDWSRVKGAVYVRSDAVNSVQMWEQYAGHEEVIDRELGLAAAYGFNMVQVYLHWIVWDGKGPEYLKRIDDFLTRADKHGLKVNLIFWDDCGHVEPSLEFKPPVPGRHNSQMMMNPSHRIRDSKAELEAHKERFRDYVTGIAARFKDDPRISFWQIYNEALGAKEKYRTSETDANINTLQGWTREWIKGTGTKIPVTATGGGFYGTKVSDFPSYHSYVMNDGALPNADGGPEHLCTETLNRPHAPVGKVLKDIARKKNGFVAWELMIGRDNCRYPWGHPDGPDEPVVPFHGVIYPDGHPWDVGEVKDLLGAAEFAKRGFFEVTYFMGNYGKEVKRSVTPVIDFDLGDEAGTGSPDASAGIPKDGFSMRWKGSFIAPESGEFEFSVETDGTGELMFGNKTVAATMATGERKSAGVVTLERGKAYPFVVGYYHEKGPARLRVGWRVGKGAFTPLACGGGR